MIGFIHHESIRSAWIVRGTLVLSHGVKFDIGLSGNHWQTTSKSYGAVMPEAFDKISQIVATCRAPVFILMVCPKL